MHGSFQGIDSLRPSHPPEVTGRRLSYWEEPNGAIDVRRPHANPEFDLAVIVTGNGIAEATQPVALPVLGGRCRPGTVVVAPNGVLRVQNQDWFAHEFFAAQPGAPNPIASFGPEATEPRSERQVQIPTAGVYELRDQRSPLFRCWIVVGPGQGKVFTPAADGSFHLSPLTDGAYTYRVYFEGRVVTEQSATVAHAHDVAIPAINLGSPSSTAGSAQAGSAPAAPPPAHHHHGGH